MNMTRQDIKETIIKRGVKNLHEFGYPYSNAENIFTDEVYSQFFKNMLEENMQSANEYIGGILTELLNEIKP